MHQVIQQDVSWGPLWELMSRFKRNRISTALRVIPARGTRVKPPKGVAPGEGP